MKYLAFILCVICGAVWGRTIGLFILLYVPFSCEKSNVDKMREDKPTNMEVTMKGNRISVKIIEWDIDPDGLITAEWEYSDGRRGGTDWTDLKWIPVLIEDQSHLPKCTNNTCDKVTDEGECWRHRPIPEHQSVLDNITESL